MNGASADKRKIRERIKTYVWKFSNLETGVGTVHNFLGGTVEPWICVRTLVHVKDADECEELSVERGLAGRQVEFGEGGQRERLEQSTAECVQRIGAGHS